MEESKRDVQLPSKRFKLAHQLCNRWGVTLAPHMTKEDLFTPRFWAIVGVQLRIGDIVEVRYDDGRAYGEFIVQDSSRIHAVLHEMHWFDLDKPDKQLVPESYQYKWMGPTWGHCVIRTTDNEPMLKELATKNDALKWIAGQTKAAA